MTHDEKLQDFVAQAQHDLRNPLGNILGFCEMLLAEAKPLASADLKQGLESIYQSAFRMVADINQVLDPNKKPAALEEVKSLQTRLRPQAAQIILDIQTLPSKADALEPGLFNVDLSRMTDSARRLGDLIETALSDYPTSGHITPSL